MNYLKKGFTLIELIIVMAILGVLAAGLIAALDPLEQINRGNDSANEAVAKQITDATQSYYTTNQVMPWGTGNLDPAVALGSAGTTTTALKANGDLKNSYEIPSKAKTSVFISGTSTGTVSVCSQISSKAGKNNINNLYDDNEGATQRTTACPAANTCFRCFK